MLPKPTHTPPPKLGRRGIYLLPNLFTTAALFSGFYAIVQAMNQRFEFAAVAIFVAMVMDGLDGRIARMTNTQSAFGAEYDSLSDMVSFGAAPALVMYEWMLRGLGKFGWLAAFVYCVAAALRLARFNTQLAVADKRFFTGLPSPAAAALVMGLLWVALDNPTQVNTYHQVLPWLAAGVTMFAGVSMVSNIPFHSFKGVNLRKSIHFFHLLLLVLLFVLVSSNPPFVLFGLFCCYAVSGYVLWGWQRCRPKRAVP